MFHIEGTFKILFVIQVCLWFIFLWINCVILSNFFKYLFLWWKISGMIPYEEPYQSMYQQRRLGALGIEWRPSSIKLAIGLDFSLGQDYAMPPLEDLERMMEPVPEFIDPVYWEPENEVISDDNDSEYNIAEECASEAEQGSFSSTSSTDCSAGDSEVEHSRKDGRRRSTRRKHRAEVISL